MTRLQALPATLGFVAFAMLLTGSGCGPTAYKITPVPVDRSLEEETLIHEGGLFPGKIVLVDVEGVIMNNEKFSLLGEGENPVSLFVEKLDKAARDPQVKALVLRINSPGGTVTASDLMYNELLYFKQRTKGERPVVAVMMDVTASGGYYIACGADHLVANPTTVTGSVGVIIQLINFEGTLDKIGMNAPAITSGRMKDAGSPFKHLSDEEREVFQTLVDQFYDRFVTVVAAGRPAMGSERIRELADGRIWSAQQALELGFIDEIGTLRTALAAVKKQIGAEKVKVVTYKRPMGYKPNIYAETPARQPQVNLINLNFPPHFTLPQAHFLYLWAPGM